MKSNVNPEYMVVLLGKASECVPFIGEAFSIVSELLSFFVEIICHIVGKFPSLF